jgi:dTMP kinase
MTRGRLVAIEGIDRAGKSSLLHRMPSALPDCRVPLELCSEFQSPLRDVFRDALGALSPFQKTYLFAADRAWTYEGTCLPALEEGRLVLWDRYVASALAYRSVELGREETQLQLDDVRAINRPFRGPDLTLLIEISVETSVARAAAAGRPEPYSAAFLHDVSEAYRTMAVAEGWAILDGEAGEEMTATAAATAIRGAFPELFR